MAAGEARKYPTSMAVLEHNGSTKRIPRYKPLTHSHIRPITETKVRLGSKSKLGIPPHV